MDGKTQRGRRGIVRASEAGSLALATLSLVVFLIVSGLAASPNASKYGFKNSTTAISNEFVTQVTENSFFSQLLPFFCFLVQVTPANFTFAIWGLIFLWQSAWLVYAWTFQCRPEAVRTICTSTYTGFAASSVVNVAWLYLFGNELVNWSSLSLVAFVVIIYLTISAFAFSFYASYSTASNLDDVLTRVLVLNGLSLYATWATIAVFVNFSIVLQYYFNIDPSTVGTVTLALLAGVVVIYFLLENTVLDQYARDVFTVYPVVIWALIGIVDKHWGVPGEGRNAVFALVLLLGTVGLVFLRSGLFVVFYHFRQRSSRGKKMPAKSVELL